MFCPQCGSKQPDDAQFCAQCGAPLGMAGDANAPRVTPEPATSAEPETSPSPAP
ncbi:zinc-ribbon domain-containing protein, partial [uncultured Enorma sp.]|uniref:zinc-ribbon domain-containing protein n=1 Tax=uncultured Enorma sp. TaxID=1714346 RepID=UPI0034583077